MNQRVGTGYVARRRPVLPRSVVWGLTFLLTAAVWVGTAASRQADPRAALATVPAAPAPVEAGSIGARLGDGQVSRAGGLVDDAVAGQVFATVHGLPLRLPHPTPLLVAFHEATRPEALTMDPVGRLLGNDNPTKFTPGDDVSGPEYRVLSSRGRARPATSAADIVLPEGSLVMAPVTGRVTEVREYVLYGRVRDWRVVIEPEGRPDLQVVLIHLHQPRVQPGTIVQAGATPLAAVRLLPMASHVDVHTSGRHPHAHLEVKPAVGPEPVDPNEPALAPGQDRNAEVVHNS